MRNLPVLVLVYTFCAPLDTRAETEPHAQETVSPASVLELFKALPDAAVHARIRDRSAVLAASDDAQNALRAEQPYWTKHDAHAGRIVVTSVGDGEGWQEHFKAFTLPTGESVLLSVSTDWGMCGDQSKVTVWQLGKDGFEDVTAHRWSVPTWRVFNLGRPTTEQHKRIPRYAVFFGEGDDITINLDQCQFEYPGPLGPLIFDPVLDLGTSLRARLSVKWTEGQFVIVRGSPSVPK